MNRKGGDFFGIEKDVIWSEDGRRQLKIALQLTGILLILKYVLPELWPLSLSGILAALLWPLTSLLVRRLRLPRSLAAAFSLAVGLGLLAVMTKLLCLLCCRLAPAVAERLPACMDLARRQLGELCLSVERGLSLRPGVLYVPLGAAAEKAMQTMTTECLQGLTRQGAALWQQLPEIGISMGVLLIGVILWQTDGGQLKEKVANAPVGRRILTAGAHMRRTFLCQLRCELLGIAATAIICAAAFALTGSRRSFLMGAVVALLDILPLLGAAIVLAPLTILALLRRRYLHALIYVAALLLIWLIRQWIDARLMGRRLGLTSLETIMAMWCGWQLLGFWGFVLGPGIAVFIVEILNPSPKS